MQVVNSSRVLSVASSPRVRAKSGRDPTKRSLALESISSRSALTSSIDPTTQASLLVFLLDSPATHMFGKANPLQNLVALLLIPFTYSLQTMPPVQKYVLSI